MKKDNSAIAAKIELRRRFLRVFPRPFQVLDCCAGNEKIWGTLRAEFSPETYLSLDLKRRENKLKLDSSRYLSMPGWKENIIDIDTYGSPWKHYLACIRNAKSPHLLIFLTIGQQGNGRSPEEYKEALGLKGLNVPQTIITRLRNNAISSLLTTGCTYEIIKAEEYKGVEWNGDANRIRYIGIRMKRNDGHL